MKALKLLALALAGLMMAGCDFQPKKSEFLGLNLNDRYTREEAGAILKQRTGVEFGDAPEGSNYLLGENVSFAGRKWDRVLFRFADDRLDSVRFFLDYILSYNNPNGDPQIPQAQKEMSGLYDKLVARYGDPAANEDGHFSWTADGKVIDAMMGSYIRYMPDLPQGYQNLLTVELGYAASEPAESDWGEGL